MKIIRARLLDDEGYVLRTTICDTQKEAILKAKHYLANEDNLSATKVDVVINDECVWDAFIEEHSHGIN